jgi:hypothetical protein
VQAAIRLRCRCPLAIGTAPQNLESTSGNRRRSLGSAPTPTRQRMRSTKTALASGLFSARKSVTHGLWFRQCPSTWLSWVFPSKDLAPPAQPDLRRASPPAVTAGANRSWTRRPRLRVSIWQSSRASREAAAPPGVPYLLAHHGSSARSGPGVTSSKSGARHRVPATSLWTIYLRLPEPPVSVCR